MTDAALAFQGPLSGTFAWVGVNLCRSIEIALQHAAEDGLVEGRIPLRVIDSAGDPDRAAQAAESIVEDESVVALIGPTFSREAEASGEMLDEAALPFLLPVATKPELCERGWSSFFRLVANDAVRAPLTATLMHDELEIDRVAVVRDESDSGRRLAELLASALAEAGADVVYRGYVRRDDGSYREAAGAVAASGAEGLYFAGEYREAGLLRRELVDQQGFPAVFVSDDGVLTPRFVETAGAAAEGALVTFPGADAERSLPRFDHDYRAAHGTAPAAFATEAYEATQLVVRALAEAGPDREGVGRFLRAFAGDVAGNEISFDAQGERVPQSFYAYEVVDGAWRFRSRLTAPFQTHPGGAPV